MDWLDFYRFGQCRRWTWLGRYWRRDFLNLHYKETKKPCYGSTTYKNNLFKFILLHQPNIRKISVDIKLSRDLVSLNCCLKIPMNFMHA